MKGFELRTVLVIIHAGPSDATGKNTQPGFEGSASVALNSVNSLRSKPKPLSSVTEAQACGIPVVVGATNGNADYLCERDTRLAEQSAAALVRVFADYAQRKAEGRLGDPRVSRNRAESLYSPALVARRVIAAIEETIAAR